MASEKLLSVVIPFYNTETEYCRKCLDSLAAFPRGDAEVIVVNDGSRPDAWESMLSLLGGYDVDARTFSKENGGQNSARQLGLDGARGEYVLFCDSDDYIEPGALWEVVAHAHESSTPILAFGFDRVRPDGSVIETCSPWPEGFAEGDVGRLVLASDSLCRQVYRVEALRALPFGLVQGIRIGEDLASSMSILLKVGKAETFGGVVYHYVQHEDSIFHNPPKDAISDIQVAFDAVLKRCQIECAEYINEIEWMAVNHALCSIPMRHLFDFNEVRPMKKTVFAWMNDRFPKWRETPYLRSSPIMSELRVRLLVSGHWNAYLALRLIKRALLRLMR